MSDFKYSILIEDFGDASKIDDLFLLHLYIYFLHGGYHNIIIDDIVNILISVFMMLFIKFLYSSVDFIGLFTNTGNHHINEYIHLDNYGKFDGFMGISFTIFIIYIVFSIIKTYQNIDKFHKIKKFYNDTLHIRDMEIRTFEWEEIINKLVNTCHNVSNVNVYTVTSRIMKIDNIFISLWDKKQIPFTYLNTLLELNIKYCFLNTLQEGNDKISNKILTNKEDYKNKVKHRIFVIGIINLLFMPFILLFAGFYVIIEYGEEFYNSPKLIASRRWTKISKWRFRFYNELPHVFNNRMSHASIEMKKYFEQFNHRILEIVSRLIVFIISSIFLLLVFIVFINENNLNNIGIFGFQPILWHITICATTLAIFRNFTKSNIMTHPKESLEKANQHLYMIAESNIKCANTVKIKNKMATYYQYQIICLIKEIFSIIITPLYYMPILYEHSDKICDFIIEHIEYHHIMGNVSKFSIFTNYSRNQINKHPKLKYSIETFKNIHKSWNINELQLTDTINEDPNLNLPDNSMYEPLVSINNYE